MKIQAVFFFFSFWVSSCEWKPFDKTLWQWKTLSCYLITLNYDFVEKTCRCKTSRLVRDEDLRRPLTILASFYNCEKWLEYCVHTEKCTEEWSVKNFHRACLCDQHLTLYPYSNFRTVEILFLSLAVTVYGNLIIWL